MTKPDMVFGFCATAQGVGAGEIRSSVDVVRLHAMCPGAFSTPHEPLLCACGCHADQEVVPRPVVKHLTPRARARLERRESRRVAREAKVVARVNALGDTVDSGNPKKRATGIRGQRVHGQLDEWGAIYKKGGKVQLDCPSDKREITLLSNRLRNAGYKLHMKVSVRVEGDKLVATATGMET